MLSSHPLLFGHQFQPKTTTWTARVVASVSSHLPNEQENPHRSGKLETQLSASRTIAENLREALVVQLTTCGNPNEISH